MEKGHKHKSLILNFQNPTFSPGRDHHHHYRSAYKGFSGPLNFAVLPDEARVKPKNGSYDPQEPTSPKVSCMGQIKYKHKKNKLNITKAADKNNTTPSSSSSKERKKSVSAISKLFSMRSSSSKGTSQANKEHGKCEAQDHKNNKIKVVSTASCPSLGQMRKFASGRESLANFDWTAQIAPVDHDHHDRDCFSDDEKRRRSPSDDHDDDDDDEESHEVHIIPFSAPIMVGGRLNLEARKEINLWKRRTLDPPPPLSCIKI